ncbi:hypothetical protein BZA05DRAFT_315711, partial [Tricharina praecox]|uniref:uncharacterized protein n=1 Tax=Tricharina praecox TaxID=43433 RepID=UPI0022200645
GDSFTNNLLTDLAPILALFGEQVTKQFLSQTITWYDCVIFAIFPLGIITTVVSAIRVAAPNSWKALVGRARESRAMAELELLSSTSLEVCEMWDGQAIVRVMGSPQILELVYVKERKDKKECGLYTLRDESERETKHAADVETQRHSQPLEGFDGTDGAPAPNISLNLAPPPYSRKQSLLWFVAFAASLQLGVLVFCAMAIYHPPWIPRFRKDGSPVVGSAYPVAAAGIITTTVGMFLCAWIIEQSTKEEAWQAKAEESTSTAGAAPAEPQVHILWLQQRKIVNDQSFDSYAIFAPGLRDCILTSRRDENMGSHGRTPQQSGDSMVELSGPHQKLAIIGAVTTIVGFTLSFSGLRLMHWSATMAQFVGTAIMTCVRIWLRRDLAGRPDAQWVLDGYEMDWLALELAARGESLW